ncbi:MAG: hypothetical protein IJP86_11255 [Synergistaceae bacterium]|nr:hypothetical protein [Synergistaceae bacterium]
MYSEIPIIGKIPVIEAHAERDKDSVLENYAQAVRFKVGNMNLRCWLMDVMRCVDRIRNETFSLYDIYKFTDELRRKHPENHNIDAKIRQQLQYLRDKGFIEFLGDGLYQEDSNFTSYQPSGIKLCVAFQNHQTCKACVSRVFKRNIQAL